MSLASKLKKKKPPVTATLPPHLVVEAYAGSGKTFTQIVGVAWAFAPDIWPEIVREIAIRGGKDPETFVITPSPEQQAVWDSLALSRGQVQTITYCAFNKSIVTEFGESWGWLVKLLQTQGIILQFATVNSLGAKVCNAAYGRLECVDWHTENLVGKHLRRDPRELKRNPSDALMLKAVCDIVGLCKLTLAGWIEQGQEDLSDEVLDRLCAHFDIDLNGSRRRVYDLVPEILTMSMDPLTNKSMDFNDQNWLPIVNDLPIPQVDLILADECQDLPRAKQEFIRRMGRRIVLVGDRQQAIYGFAGADVDSIPRMTKLLSGVVEGAKVRLLPFEDQPEEVGTVEQVDRTTAVVLLDGKPTRQDDRLREVPLDQIRPTNERGCQVLRLTQTRRCGKLIVEEAKRIVPDFSAHESNCEGKVSRTTLSKFPDMTRDGDMVLCRVNAPLVSQALKMIKSGRKAVIRGRDFGGQLITFVRKMEAQDVVHLMTKVGEYTRVETQKENAKTNPSEMRLMSIQDRQDCVEVFADGALSVTEVVERMELVFAGKVCVTCGKHYVETTEQCYGCKLPLTRPEGVIFSSIHRAKGLEANRVFCLDLKGCTIPHPMCKTEWSRQQDWNGRYIQITRAIQELVYVTDDPI